MHGSSSSTSGRSGKNKTSAKDKEEKKLNERMSYLRQSLIKSFHGHGNFEGWVQEYRVDKDTYIVVYEDGDSEELFYNEMKTLVRKTRTVTSAVPFSAKSISSSGSAATSIVPRSSQVNNVFASVILASGHCCETRTNDMNGVMAYHCTFERRWQRALCRLCLQCT